MPYDQIFSQLSFRNLTIKNRILRSNIAEIRASHVSLMPDGLEAGMTPQDVADLIAFLQGSNLRPR